MPSWPLFLGSPITVASAPFGLPLLIIFGGILICVTVTRVKTKNLVTVYLKEILTENCFLSIFVNFPRHNLYEFFAKLSWGRNLKGKLGVHIYMFMFFLIFISNQIQLII